MAIECNYPESKMPKLLKRKIAFAHSVGNNEMIRTTLMQIENNSYCKSMLSGEYN